MVWINYKGDLRSGVKCPKCGCAPAGILRCWNCKTWLLLAWFGCKADV
jgi:hypothetical protein